MSDDVFNPSDRALTSRLAVLEPVWGGQLYCLSHVNSFEAGLVVAPRNKGNSLS